MTSILATLKRFPRAYRLAFAMASRARAAIDTPRYWWCRSMGRVYIGPVMAGQQTWRTRAPRMVDAIREELARTSSTEFRVLEIGSWAGQSALLWGEEIRRSGRPGKVFCVDPWLPFASPEQSGINDALARMSKFAAKDHIFPLFWHNVRSARLERIIVPIRGLSVDVLPALATRSFDLVFVDGSHVYSDFLRDLKMAMPLVRDGGIICGDDLELQFDQVDQDYARDHCERDFLTDPRTAQEYHPGVTTGVFDVFQRRIDCRDGFWLQRQGAAGWTDTT